MTAERTDTAGSAVGPGGPDVPVGTGGPDGPRPDRAASGRWWWEILLAPLRARTWRHLLYAFVCLALAPLSLAYVVVSVVVGAALSVTFVGLPLMTVGLAGARHVGAMYRALQRNLCGVEVAAPPPLRRRPGALGWIQSGLGDVAAWRAMAFLALRVPLAIPGIAVSVAFWCYGLFFIGTNAWWWSQPPEDRVHLVNRFDPGLLTGLGVVVFLAAPWVVRGWVALDGRLVRGLLGPTTLSERVRDLERTRARVVDSAATDLRRIERDLHDGTQARLVALTMRLGMVKEQLDEGDTDGDTDPRVTLERTRSLVDTAHSNAKEALTELRDLVRGIHPPVLDNGLDAALATLAARSAVPVEVRADLSARPSPAVETIAYFCVAELLTNAAKHSGATRVTVEVSARAQRLRLRLHDDGRGGAAVRAGLTAAGTGSGLAGLTERVRTVDGDLRISSPRGGPTVIAVDLPMHV